MLHGRLALRRLGSDTGSMVGFIGISEDSQFSGIRLNSIPILWISGNALRFEERIFTTCTGKTSTKVFGCAMSNLGGTRVMDQDDQGQERHRQASRVLCLHLVELTHFFVSSVSGTLIISCQNWEKTCDLGSLKSCILRNQNTP